jgi:hypothetical protein
MGEEDDLCVTGFQEPGDEVTDELTVIAGQIETVTGSSGTVREQPADVHADQGPRTAVRQCPLQTGLQDVWRLCPQPEGNVYAKTVSFRIEALT